VSPSNKLDAMFTFLKINYQSLWGNKSTTNEQFEAKLIKIKMQLESIDEDGLVKMDINDLRAEVKRLQSLQSADQIDDDFNPAMLVEKQKLAKASKKAKKKRSMYDDSASAEPRLD